MCSTYKDITLCGVDCVIVSEDRDNFVLKSPPSQLRVCPNTIAAYNPCSFMRCKSFFENISDVNDICPTWSPFHVICHNIADEKCDALVR